MNMEVVYNIGDTTNDCCLSLETMSEAIATFIDRYEIMPDVVSIHHIDYMQLSKFIPVGTKVLTFGEKAGEIYFESYIGLIKIELRLRGEERHIHGSFNAYIKVYNSEAKDVDNILLGEEKSSS